MNPNFSSDGRYITFMGLPKTRTYSHYSSWAEYLDLFIYDFRDDRLINLSANVGRGSFNQFEEDPVFSPDGQYVAFKHQRSDIWVARLSDYTLRRVTAGAGEESGPQYSPDGSWITFWVGDGANAYIAKVSSGSTSATTYTTIVDNDVAGDAGIQDYFPSYWDESRLIYTSWDTAQLPGVNDDDDIRIRNLSSGSDYLAAFNSAYPIDDSDAFPITSDLLGFSKRQGSYWDLWYGDPVAGGAETLGIGDANKHNLGGEYTTSIVSYVPNNAPTDLALSNNTVSENESSGTTVGTLSTTDPDAGNTFTYSLVSGSGSSDNASFSIVDDRLQTDATFNFESDSSYTIRVRTSDQGGLWYEEIFSISVINVNETPVGMSLSSSAVNENQPAETLVGSISTSDPDAGDSFSYTLVGGAGSADNDSFSIVGDEVQADTSFNYEVQNSCSIRVRTTDHGGLWYEKTFTIDISDVSEPAPIIEAPSLSADGKSVLHWSSIANHMYTIYFTTNLTEGFSMLRENIPATPPTNTHTNFTEGVRQGFWYISTDE